MKKLTQLVAVTSLVMPPAFLASSSSANAAGGVLRNQMETLSITATLTNFGIVHAYTVTLNPCNNTFAGTGDSYFLGFPSSPYVYETVTGSYVNGTLNFTATYLGTTYGNPFVWWIDPATISFGSPASGTAHQNQDSTTYALSISLNDAGPSSSYKNHGEYVAANPGSDAAHSCIGMPIQSMS